MLKYAPVEVTHSRTLPTPARSAATSPAPTLILCDFDDTAADRNVATLLLDRFRPADAIHDWRHIRRQFHDGHISLAEYQERSFAPVSTPLHDQAAHVRKAARLRPGFRELAAYCAQHSIVIAIVSHGLDFYVQALLEGAGLTNVSYFAVRTGLENGSMTFHYDFARRECDWWPGNCKCSVLRQYTDAGYYTIYAGDGSSDICPAQRADFVFARDTLLRFCQERGIPHQQLDDFHVVLDYLKNMTPRPEHD
ncbi:MAG: MtnX-like HAD-IB family phosphatase [Dehalococcoidia bacterium]